MKVPKEEELSGKPTSTDLNLPSETPAELRAVSITEGAQDDQDELDSLFEGSIEADEC